MPGIRIDAPAGHSLRHDARAKWIHLQRFGFGTIDNQPGVCRKEPDRRIRPIPPDVPHSRMLCEECNSLPNDRFHAVRHGFASLSPQIAPYFRKIRCSFRRENTAPHAAPDFSLARYASSASSGIPSPRSSCSMPRRIFALCRSRCSCNQRSCSSCVSSKRSSTSSTFSEPVASASRRRRAARLASRISMLIAAPESSLFYSGSGGTPRFCSSTFSLCCSGWRSAAFLTSASRACPGTRPSCGRPRTVPAAAPQFARPIIFRC